MFVKGRRRPDTVAPRTADNDVTQGVAGRGAHNITADLWPLPHQKTHDMRTATLVVLTTLVALAASARNSYTNKFDNIDVDKILNNDRILTQYIKCLMDEGSCTTEGRELKSE